jgi:acyl-CoA reductase-like NAD-dependent aldehyde dehydrogenase
MKQVVLSGEVGRRTLYRYKDEITVELLREKDGPGAQSQSAKVIDVCEKGLSVSLPKTPWNIGDDILVSLQLAFPFQSISARGNVRWRKTDGFKSTLGLSLIESFDNGVVLRDYFQREMVQLKLLADRREKADRAKKNTDHNRRKQWKTEIEEKGKSAGIPNTDNDNICESIDLKNQDASKMFLEIPLLVDGEEIKTENIEYFPYVEKVIADLKTTRSMISELKKGFTPKQCDKYIFGKYYIGQPDTNLRAMKAAREASLEFRETPLSKRHQIMMDIYQALVANKKILIDLMVVEGHPISLATWEYEGMKAAFNPETLAFYKKEMLKEMGSKEMDDIFILRRPDGVVCLSPPKNAPCSIPIIAAFSLLAGNAMVVKPPLRSPIACSYLWQNIIYPAARSNGAPAGIINTVIGHSETIMREWFDSPFTDDIFFFGDSKMGLEIGTEAFRCGKKPILELSGNDFMLVWEDAPIDQAVDSLVDGLRGSLQICMAPKKVFVHPAIFDDFLSRVVDAVKQRVKPGLPSDPKTYLTPVTRLRECGLALENAISKGARLMTGGHRINHLNQPTDSGIFFEATVIAIKDDNPLRFECVSDENYFPLLPVVTPTSYSGRSEREIFDWMVDITNRNDYSLRISVWTKSRRLITQFAQAISNCGLLRINAPHTGFSTFLGSNGGGRRSGGPFGEMNYPWLKTSHLQGVNIRW